MVDRVIFSARYVLRATGLVLAIGGAAVVFGASVFGNKPNAAVAVAACVAIAGAVLSWPRIPAAWRRDPPTPRQLEYAAKLGIAIRPGVSKGELSDLISQATGH